MASRFTSISNIVASRIHWKLKCRIMRLWVVTNFNNPSTETSLEMLLVDEKGGKIHAHVKKSLINDFKTILEEGQTNVIENLLVAANDHKFRTTKHKFKLNFMGISECKKIVEDILKYQFDFMIFPDILAATREDTSSVTSLRKTTSKKHLYIKCTRWEDFAEQMQQHLDKLENAGPIILVIQGCKRKNILKSELAY
ncbi:hypothetical protein HKD37_13G036736 [Glycine soja]|nr:hypothetical protein GmHk_13G036745 [Glycine max]